MCRSANWWLRPGWEPLTAARSDNESVYVERFGTRYLTVFNDGPQRRTVTVTMEGKPPASSRELVTGRKVPWNGRAIRLTLESEGRGGDRTRLVPES